MRKLLLILQLFYFTNTLVSQTSVGYFNYGRSGKMSWSNHLSINSSGQLVMAGTFDDKANFIVANSSGTYSTNRTVAGTGELFSAVVDASGNIFVGGCHGAVWTNPAKTKYIVKYTSAMTQSYAKQFGLGTIRYLTTDGTDIVATGYNTKPCVIKLDNAGNTIWYKEYTVDGKDGDAFSIVKIGTNYYVAGNIKEAGANRGYVMSIDAATGNVNWCNTYNSAGNPPHLTGMSKSSTGLILCGATGLMGSGKLMAMKIDFSGNLVWSRLINSCYSWYEKDPTTYNIWSINCAVDPYGSVVVAYEDDPSYGMLAKLNETTGTVTWIKRFGNSGDGFHGITVSGCAYLASGWFGPTIGSSWDYGLVVADTSGNTGGTGTCGTTVTRTNSVPTITTGTATVTSANLTTNTTYASATNTTETMSHNAICSTSVGSSVTPTINTTPPTCSSPSVSTITNYDASSNYVFTPSGPTVGAGGVISGMVDGTSYTVSASNSLCSNSSPSASFSNAPMLTVPNTPTITTTPVSCNTSSTSTITNFDSTLTYVFTPAGPTVGVGGVINGAVDGTTYSVTAGNGSCSSQASTFTNSSSSPITVTVSSNSVCVNGTLTLTPTTGGTWVSNNPSVATVTSGGVVSIVSNGSVDFTFTDLNSCTATTSVVTVNPSEDASFSYPSGSYCLTDANPTPTITGTSGGTFTINNSGVINATTGVINISSSGTGSYVVTYITPGVCKDTSTFNVTITSSTDATITQAGPFCLNASPVNLTAVSPGGTWSGTGITNATNGTFNPTTAGVGNHVITYTISGSCGSTDTVTIVVNPSEDASFSYPSGSYCLTDANPTPTITGTSGGTFTINNSGVINAITGLINITTSGVGSYTVTYITPGVCKDTSTFNVTITNSTDATITQAGQFCLNASPVNLTAVSPGGTWSGTGITNATNGTFNPTTAGVGNHVITYTISGSCGSTDTVTLVVNPSENAAFSYATNTFCLTDANPTPTITGTSGGTFTINNGGSINATTGLINITASGAGAFTVTYITPGACKDTSTFTLNINNCSSPLPVSNFAASQTTICVGACISYTDMSSSSAVGGITTWSWTFTGGTPSTSTTQSPTSVCYNTAGTYEVSLTVTDANGTDTETKTAYITVNACTTPTASFTLSDTTLCAGECVTFTNTSTGATSWQWTFQNGTPPTSSNQNPGSVCFNTAGTQNIKLVVSNPYGSDSVTHTINVVQPQQVVIGNDTTIQLGETVNLSATGVANGTYVWSPTTDLSCSVCPSPTSTPQETITYTVITSDTNGCTSTDNITIIVEFDNVIFVPNIFSPNNDGANDILYVRGKGVQKLRFFIYDRWGEKVFETSDLNVGWDGTFRGEDMNKAVFVYYLEATFIDGKEVTQKGDITLVK